MAAFEYVAVTAQGQQKKGVMEGDSSKQIRQHLRDQGLVPLQVESVKAQKASSKSSFSFLSFTQPSLTVPQLALFTRQLSTLIAAGMPLEECLRIIAEQTDKARFKSLILAVRAKVLEGHTLAFALREFPQAFPELYRGTIAAGEQSGRLDLVLTRLADYTEQQQQIRQKIQQAIIYPSIMVVVSISIVIFLLIYVVPKIVGVFNSTGQQLPELTKILIGISTAVQHYGIYALIAIFLLVLTFIYALHKSRKFRYSVHAFLLKLPLIGNLIKVVNTAHFSRTFGILTAAGLPALEAMHIAAELVTNLVIRKAIEFAANQVREGASIYLALKQTHYFPLMSIYLIASGESSGQLAAMLDRAASNQEETVRNFIDLGLRLFEPILILVMGSVVLFIVLAIMLPIFDLDQFTG